MYNWLVYRFTSQKQESVLVEDLIFPLDLSLCIAFLLEYRPTDGIFWYSEFSKIITFSLIICILIVHLMFSGWTLLLMYSYLASISTNSQLPFVCQHKTGHLFPIFGTWSMDLIAFYYVVTLCG